jgi:hypothetical protein
MFEAILQGTSITHDAARAYERDGLPPRREKKGAVYSFPASSPERRIELERRGRTAEACARACER